ncbi:hypothetical protein GCM10011505_50750 [Tistrella bauzanensis]|uniref:AB hydrolase-1 domain-containing protein n=1 Tax=Tistrella bauzanensis TaxID=657419 RepID=A0ABQ1JED9_9PROT|nr:hypothetical protein GCM10011505_50750 [Tistrella bauzanensis]
MRGRIVGLLMSGQMLGIMLARPIASLVADEVSWHAVFAQSAICLLAAFMVLARALPRRMPATSPDRPLPRAYRFCDRTAQHPFASPALNQEFIMQHDVIPTSAEDTLPPFDAAMFWANFRHGTVTVNGVRLHFVEGGRGAPVLLLPGWPQSWYVWRYVMPLLAAAGRRVIALDPRGMGDSDRPAAGYDMRTAAADVHDTVEALGLIPSPMDGHPCAHDRMPMDMMSHG